MSSATTESVLRYIPGQDYAFLHCKFRRSHKQTNGMLAMGMAIQLGTYRPYDVHHHLLNLEVVKLRCVDHHKVPWDQDPYGALKHDGFVFESYEEPVKRWFNQYPRACYGQIDDSHDRFLYLDYVGAGMSTKEVVAEAATDKGMTELQDATYYLGNIRRGIVSITKAADWPAVEKAVTLAALKVFEAQVQDLIEKAVGKKCKLMQVMYEPPADGKEPILMDWFDVVYEGDPEFLHTCWEDGRGQRRLIPPIGTEA